MDNQYVRGTQKLKVRIATIRANLDLPALRDEIGGLLWVRTLARFDRQVDPNEKPWQPLSESSRSSKNSSGAGGKPLLVRSGALRSSIAVIAGGLGSTFVNTGAGLRIGIQDAEVALYARLHNRGLGGMPRRQFLGIGPLDVKAVDAIMRRKAKRLETL